MNDAPVVVEQSALQMMESASVNQQVKTAKQFPRDVVKVKKNIVAMACMDEVTAGECHYCIPRAGKTIEGPSVRLAEIVASQWGNLRTYAYVVDADNKFVTAECIAYDMEANFAHKHQVRRRITDKSGNRFSDDMVVVTANAASSIAFREAIFKIAPRAIVKAAYDAALRFSTGDESKLPDRRKKMVERFVELGVTDTMLLRELGRATVEDIGTADLQKAVGIFNALADGDVSIREIFGGQKSPEKTAPAPVSEPAPTPPKTETPPPAAAEPPPTQEEVPATPAEPEKKKRGRPPGSKNKAKEESAAPPEREAPAAAAPTGQNPQQEYETLLLQLETAGKGESLSTVMTQAVKDLNKTIDEFTDADYAHVNTGLRKVLDEA